MVGSKLFWNELNKLQRWPEMLTDSCLSENANCFPTKLAIAEIKQQHRGTVPAGLVERMGANPYSSFAGTAAVEKHGKHTLNHSVHPLQETSI